MTSNEVEKLAYDLWDKDGRPDGRDKEYYYAAERMLAQGGNGVAVAEAPAKKRSTRSAASAAKPKTTRAKKQS